MKSSLKETLNQGGGIFVHDGQHGIYVYIQGAAFRYLKDRIKSGDIYRLRGNVAPGSITPQLQAHEQEFIGHSPLPTARQVGIGEILDPELDCDWIRFPAVMLEIRETTRPGQVIARVVSDDLLLNVVVPDSPNTRAKLESFTYKDIEIEAVATSRVDSEGHYTGRVFRAATIDSFSLLPIEELAPKGIKDLYNSAAPPLQKARVRGIVLHAEGREIFLQDGDSYLHVTSPTETGVERGDRIEVQGRVQTLRPGARMQGAEVMKRIEGEVPSARGMPDPADYDAGADAGALLKTRGRVLMVTPGRTTTIIECEARGGRFDVLLANEWWGDRPIAVGAEIEVTGIALPALDIAGRSRETVLFSLRVRDREDVEVLVGAPFWTRDRILLGTGLLLALSLAISLWAWLLRRKVREQTELIGDKIEREATYEERQRIARELHDTFQQEMTGLSLQLSLLDQDLDSQNVEQAKKSAALAGKMLDYCREGAKETINDLRCFGNLPALLKGLFDERLRPRAEAVGAELTLAITGDPEVLPARCEHHLARIITEAVSNAIQHAEAQKIDVSLDYSTALTVVTIRDDGTGFDVKKVPPVGHFGLVGIRERVNRMQAECAINSISGEGTVVVVELKEST